MHVYYGGDRIHNYVRQCMQKEGILWPGLRVNTSFDPGQKSQYFFLCQTGLLQHQELTNDLSWKTKKC